MVSKQKLFRFWWINIRTEVQLKTILSTDLENLLAIDKHSLYRGTIYIKKDTSKLLWVKKEDVCWAWELRIWSSARLLLFLTSIHSLLRELSLKNANLVQVPIPYPLLSDSCHIAAHLQGEKNAHSLKQHILQYLWSVLPFFCTTKFGLSGMSTHQHALVPC